MSYYYLHPFKPQYFFPTGFQDHELFLSFFQPYSRNGAISWWLFRNIGLYRSLFVNRDIERYIPEKNIRKRVGGNPILAFNKGTPGPEQKISALGVDKGNSFFIKYANSSLAKGNVKNEYEILKQLPRSDFAPLVLDYFQDDNEVLLKTSVLRGRRVGCISLCNSIIEVLLNIAEIQLKTWNNCETDLKTSFAHGDFCPWNMMENKGCLYLYDWEMAGTYPLGYDLFTLVFQTAFLLRSKATIENIILENEPGIKTYFDNFNIADWSKYLAEFSRIKVSLNTQKGLTGLSQYFQRLWDYVEKT